MEVDSKAVERASVPAVIRDDPEAMLLRASLGAEWRAALDGLPDAYRQDGWLRDVEDFSYGEIAPMLQAPLGTVMSRISRGRRLLMARLDGARARAGGKASAST